MDIFRLAQILKAKTSSAMNDYSQLENAYPNAQKFVSALRSNVEQHIPSNEDFNSPQKMGEWSLNTALNQPNKLSTRNSFLNEIHPDKNFVSWEKTADPIFDNEGEEIGENPYILIQKVFTHPDDRGKGIATKLMENSMNEIKKQYPHLPIRLTPIPLDKDTDIERLADFYRKFGFEDHPEGFMEY